MTTAIKFTQYLVTSVAMNQLRLLGFRTWETSYPSGGSGKYALLPHIEDDTLLVENDRYQIQIGKMYDPITENTFAIVKAISPMSPLEAEQFEQRRDRLRREEESRRAEQVEERARFEARWLAEERAERAERQMRTIAMCADRDAVGRAYRRRAAVKS